jgi:hypothetical protein
MMVRAPEQEPSTSTRRPVYSARDHDHDHDHDHGEGHDHDHSHDGEESDEEEFRSPRDPLRPEAPLPFEQFHAPKRLPSSNPLLELVLRFTDFQAERVQAFRLLEQSFVEYIATKDVAGYNETLGRVGSVFRNSKAGIAEVRTKLEADKPEICQSIGAIEELEMQKLRKTSDLQKMRAETLFGEADFAREIAEVEVELRRLTDLINEEMDNVAAEKADL